MSQQQFPLEQDTPFWILIQGATDGAGEVVGQAGVHYGQYQWDPIPQPPYSYEGVDLGVDYLQDDQHYATFQNIDFMSITNYAPPLQAYNQPLEGLFPDPPPSSPIPIASAQGPSDGPSPTPSHGTSASTSSSVSAVSANICRQAWPRFNEEAQQWSCGGCNKSFSDKYGAERHIATVGRKVTCRYCGSRISALESSRRRHFRRESCKRQAIERGYTTRTKEDAFLEDH